MTPEQTEAYITQHQRNAAALLTTQQQQDEAASAQTIADAALLAEQHPELTPEQALQQTCARVIDSKEQAIEAAQDKLPDPDAANGYALQIQDENGLLCRAAILRTADIELMPNFKTGSDPDLPAGRQGSGEVHPLTGTYTPDHPPISIFRNATGQLLCMSGRHRLAHARRAGAEKISAYIYDETPERNAAWAHLRDIEWNIKDNQVTPLDVALLIRGELSPDLPPVPESHLTPDSIYRRKGSQAEDGYQLGTKATDSVLTALRNGTINRLQALWIAQYAPGDISVQNAGLRAAAAGEGKPLVLQALAMEQGRIQLMRNLNLQDTADLFGELIPNEAFQNFVSAYAKEKLRDLNERYSWLGSATRKKSDKFAKEYGATFDNPTFLKAERARVGELRTLWQNPMMHDQLRSEIEEAFQKTNLQGRAAAQQRARQKESLADLPACRTGGPALPDSSQPSLFNFSLSDTQSEQQWQKDHPVPQQQAKDFARTISGLLTADAVTLHSPHRGDIIYPKGNTKHGFTHILHRRTQQPITAENPPTAEELQTLGSPAARLSARLPRLSGRQAVGQGRQAPETTDATTALTSGIMKDGILRTGNAILTAPGADFSITAYHASPHNFRRFSTDHMGKGEGAQAYGWGLYFSTAKAVNKSYFRQFTKHNLLPDRKALDILIEKAKALTGHIYGYIESGKELADELRSEILILRLNKPSQRPFNSMRGYYRKSALEMLRLPLYRKLDRLRSLLIEKIEKYRSTSKDVTAYREAYKKELKEYEDKIKGIEALIKEAGNLKVSDTQYPVNYRVELNADDSNLLDFDKPVSDELYAEMTKIGAADSYMPREDVDGGIAYSSIRIKLGSPKAASEWLAAHGYKGIKYLDGSSRRGRENPTYNYVIFDGRDIKITALNESGDYNAPWQPYTDTEANFSLREQQNIISTLQESGRYNAFFGAVDELQQSGKPTGNKGDTPHSYAPVSQRLRDDVHQLTNGEINLTGGMHTVNVSDLRHSYAKHCLDYFIGDGQLNLTHDDLRMIPDIVENYDSVTVGKRSNGDTLKYTKRYGGVEYTVVEVLKSRHNNPRDTKQKTIYLNEITKSADDEALHPTTTSDGFIRTESVNPISAFIKKNYPDEAKKIVQEMRKRKQGLAAPNGKPSKLPPELWVATRLQSFRNWFGDWENAPENASKVVDANGEPLVVYHGSPHYGFTVFDKTRTGERDRGDFGKGFYFTPSRGYAATYGKEGYWNAEGDPAKVYACFLNIREPLQVQARHAENMLPWQLEEAEGVMVYTDSYYDLPWNDVKNLSEIVVHEPNQIKSATDNRGTFSAESPRIDFSLHTEETLQSWQREPLAELGELGRYTGRILSRFTPRGNDIYDARLISMQQACHRRIRELQHLKGEKSGNRAEQGLRLAAEANAIFDQLTHILPQGYRFGLEPYKEFFAVYSHLRGNAAPAQAGAALPMAGWQKRMQRSFESTLNRWIGGNLSERERADLQDLYSEAITEQALDSLRQTYIEELDTQTAAE